MPEKYIRRNGLPLLVRHTGQTTLPQAPPQPGTGPSILSFVWCVLLVRWAARRLR